MMVARASIRGRVVGLQRRATTTYLLVETESARVTSIMTLPHLLDRFAVGDFVEFTGTLRDGKGPLQLFLYVESGDTARCIGSPILRVVEGGAA